MLGAGLPELVPTFPLLSSVDMAAVLVLRGRCVCWEVMEWLLCQKRMAIEVIGSIKCMKWWKRSKRSNNGSKGWMEGCAVRGSKSTQGYTKTRRRTEEPWLAE